MTINNRDRLSFALVLLSKGLRPYVDKVMVTYHGDDWEKMVAEALKGKTINLDDSHSSLKIMWEYWNTAFKNKLKPSVRSLISEVLNVRNNWAHMSDFSVDDACRAIDSIWRLLGAVGAAEVVEANELRIAMYRKFMDEEHQKKKDTLGHKYIDTIQCEERTLNFVGDIDVFATAGLFESYFYKVADLIFAYFYNWLVMIEERCDNSEAQAEIDLEHSAGVYAIINERTNSLENGLPFLRLERNMKFKDFYKLVNYNTVKEFMEWFIKTFELEESLIEYLNNRNVENAIREAYYSFLCKEHESENMDGRQNGFND